MAALLGNRQIFSQVLFAFSAMGSAFGPVLLVTLMAGEVKPRHTLLSILFGFGLSTIAFFLFPEPETKGLERVVPFLFALLIAWSGRRGPEIKTSSQP
jgi:sodium/proline symporter